MYPPLTTHNSLLGVNLFVLGGLVVLMALRGPTTASVLLLIGSAGMAIGKIGRAWGAGEWVRNSGRCLREQVFFSCRRHGSY